MRHELKHIINYMDYRVLRDRLNKIFKKDNYVNHEGFYIVKSLYYEDVFNSAYKDKINGVNKREKFRIRYYNEDLNFIKLEKKIKINNKCIKKAELITLEEVESLLNGDIEFLLYSGSELFIEFYSKIKGKLLKPSTIIEYKREPYIFIPGNVRITLDTDIKTGLKNINFLNQNNNLFPTDPEIYGVLEVKYDEFLPEIVKKTVQTNSLSSSAFSKYAIGRRFD